MTNEAQINANRKNALKSTGPRTEEGKDAVSQNATKHGLCSCKNVIRSESHEEYNIFHDEMIEDLSPVGAMEEMLAARIVNLSWRLKRAEVFQNAAMELMIDDRLTETLSDTQPARDLAEQGDMSLIIGLALRRDFSNSKVLEELLIYEKRIESSLYKASAELRKLQKIRLKDTAWAEAPSPWEPVGPTNYAKQSQFKKEISECHPQASLEAATRCNIVNQTQFRKTIPSLGKADARSFGEGEEKIDEGREMRDENESGFA